MAGDESRAEVQLDQDTLARRRRDLGKDHPDTLASANGLAISLRAVGGHPGTLTSASNPLATILLALPVVSSPQTEAERQFAEKQKKLRKIADNLHLLHEVEVEVEVERDEEKKLNEQQGALRESLNKLLKRSERRRPLITLAIGLVFIGGVLEFLGGVIFTS